MEKITRKELALINKRAEDTGMAVQYFFVKRGTKSRFHHRELVLVNAKLISPARVASL